MVIELDRVSKVYHDPARGGAVTAVDSVCLQVQEGETHCLIGTSGCGKTTTMKMINRLVEPTAGRVLIDGTDVAKVDPIALRRRIGYVVQTGGLFPHMTVSGNIGLLCELEGWPPASTRQRVDELLELVNLPPHDFGHRFPGDLSGGQRQRVGVARALALDPAYVLMDEPFGALDPITRGQLHEEFTQLEQRVRKTIILVTHDLAEAFKLGDRVSVMHNGSLLQTGTEAELRTQPSHAFVTEFLRGHAATETDDVR